MKTIEILDPRARPESTNQVELPPASGPLRMSNVALLHNGNAKFDRIADALAGRLGDAALGVNRYRKARYGAPATDEMLGAIRDENTFAVVGLAC